MASAGSLPPSCVQVIRHAVRDGSAEASVICERLEKRAGVTFPPPCDVVFSVMRVLGIPCRVVTNFNSAHDTNGNLVIEEFYSEMGKKLKSTKDSIW